MLKPLREIVPGVSVCVIVAMAGMFLASHYQAPVMLFALLLGMTLNSLNQTGSLDAGLQFCTRHVLRIGVVLLGARFTIDQIISLGVLPFILVAVCLATTISLGLLAARLAGKNLAFGLLTGGSVGICGASAALAISSVLPRGARGVSERDVAFTVVAVTGLGTLAMIFYPMLAAQLGFNNHDTGLFLGATVHDVAQTVGAGYAVSPHSGDIATLVKLLRVAMLMPVVALVYWLSWRFVENKSSVRSNLPLFLVGFAAMVAIASAGWIGAPLQQLIDQVSRWALIIAIASVGIRTNVSEFLKVGGIGMVIVVVETLWIALAAGTLLLLSD